MAGTAYHVGSYKQISISGNVSPTGNKFLLGIFVSAASGTPTITVYDDAGVGTALKMVDTFTPVASTWYPLPMVATLGINVVLGGTVSCTVVYA